MSSRESWIKDLAREAGFDLVRIAQAAPMETERQRYLEWIEAGRQGEMRWITPEHAERSASPSYVLDGARSVICVGLGYWKGNRPPDSRGTGRVARYAWGRDYHAILGEKLASLAARLKEEYAGEHRWYVDTGPLMDKALASRSGLGWYGKNTNILTEKLGSFLVLGEIVTTLPLRPDPPLDRNCGKCRLCVVACPTGALGPDYSIDARRCISYLTIEHRGPIPKELREKMGAWVYGCDICQDVCPPAMKPNLDSDGARANWHMDIRAAIGGGRKCDKPSPEGLGAEPNADGSMHPFPPFPRHASLDLQQLLNLSHARYVEVFRGTAIKRAKVWMLRRNAAIALGNVGDANAIPSLVEAVRDDEHPIVRGHAAWALGRLGQRLGAGHVLGGLRDLLKEEEDTSVREEIEGAIARLSPS